MYNSTHKRFLGICRYQKSTTIITQNWFRTNMTEPCICSSTLCKNTRGVQLCRTWKYKPCDTGLTCLIADSYETSPFPWIELHNSWWLAPQLGSLPLLHCKRIIHSQPQQKECMSTHLMKFTFLKHPLPNPPFLPIPILQNPENPSIHCFFREMGNKERD